MSNEAVLLLLSTWFMGKINPYLQKQAKKTTVPPKVPQHSDKTTEGTQFINNTCESLTCVNTFIKSTSIYMSHDINTNYHKCNT